ncbi:hypothetical protein PT974_03242 [Cladobotryum mycophilum]|uniref:Uncharacterized protein n=1 Tax=Cladobotryum mycophilum TaxID=491253 RepID=A0ABR0SRQ6_9HYPO
MDMEPTALHSEDRLALTISVFEVDLSSEQQVQYETYRELPLMHPLTTGNVVGLTTQIDNQAPRNRDGSWRAMGLRFTRILETVQHHTNLGEGILGKSLYYLACSVWAVLKTTLLHIIVELPSHIDRIANVFLVIGRSAPGYEHMALLYPRSEILQSLLSIYFIEIVRLCHLILKFTQKSAIAQLMSAGSLDMQGNRASLSQVATSIGREVNRLMSRHDEKMMSPTKRRLFARPDMHALMGIPSVSTDSTTDTPRTRPSTVADSGYHSDPRGKQYKANEGLPTMLLPGAQFAFDPLIQETDEDGTSDPEAPEGFKDGGDKVAMIVLTWLLRQLEDVPFETILEVLPGLLEEFAFRLGHESQSMIHQNLSEIINPMSNIKIFTRLLKEHVEEKDYAKERTTQNFSQLYFAKDILATQNPSQTSKLSKEEGYSMESDRRDEATHGEIFPSSVIDDTFEAYKSSKQRQNLFGKFWIGLDEDGSSDVVKSVQVQPEDRDYWQILTNSYASAWLHLILERDLSLRGITPWAMTDVRCHVLKELRAHSLKHSSGSATPGVPWVEEMPNLSPQLYTVHFSSDWDPVSFLEQEFDEGNSRDLLSQAITVTGDVNTMQALPCEEYIRQTWPITGSNLLKLIQDIVCKPDKVHEVALTKDTFVVAYLGHDGLHLNADGIEFDIASIAEQLAWFACALQPSDRESSCFYQPHLNFKSPSSQIMSPVSGAIHCHISGLEQSALDKGEDANSNLCWQKLFETTSIAQGFPVPSRPKDAHGLEIPLNIAASIIGAQNVVKFKSRLVIKGFDSLLYSSKVDISDEGYTITWHLIETEDGSRISYADPRVGNGFHDFVDGLQYEDMQGAQHIVGWCRHVKNMTGTSKAEYSIRSSGLAPPPRGWVIEKFQISGGQHIGGGMTFARGKKLRPVKISRSKDDIIGRIEWLAEKHVILHDTSERRAWLVDGPSALLHLVRASLSSDNQPFTQQKYIQVLDKLREPQKRYTGRAASMGVLTDQENLNLELRPKGTTPNQGGEGSMYCFRDRVSELLEIIEQMMDHQSDMKADEGVGHHISRSPSNRLEGFEFRDVARRSTPLPPKVVMLHADGRGWVSFARAIHAISLFGSGFGDLLCPSKSSTDEVASCTQCLWNAPSPIGRDILAVSMADLQFLHNDEPDWNDTQSEARSVAKKFTWDNPASGFRTCTCATDPFTSTRVQTLRKQGLSRYFSLKKQTASVAGEISSSGAILLGMSSQKAAAGDSSDGPQSSFLTADDLDNEEFESSQGSEEVQKGSITSLISLQPGLTSLSLADSRTPASPISLIGSSRDLARIKPQSSPNQPPLSFLGRDSVSRLRQLREEEEAEAAISEAHSLQREMPLFLYPKNHVDMRDTVCKNEQSTSAAIRIERNSKSRLRRKPAVWDLTEEPHLDNAGAYW